MWIGTRRSMPNCSRGWSSIATSVLVVVPPVPGRVRILPPVARRRADAGNRAIDAQHPGGDAKKEQHDHPPWPWAAPAINRPPQPGRNHHRDDDLDADAEAETQTLLHSRAVADRRLPLDPPGPRLIEALAEPRQPVRWRLLAHLSKRNHP